jgi:SnoaL-like domain
MKEMDTLAQLMAIEHIKQLKARYFRTMDTRDFDAMALVFCRDALFDCTEGFGCAPVGGVWEGEVGPVTRGRDAIITWIRGAFANQTSVHHGHSHEVTIDSDTEAHGIVAMEDYIRALDRRTKLVHGTGHYHEHYRFEDGEWRIAKTKLTRLFVDRF